jgi:AraC-like DNA-binding protein
MVNERLTLIKSAIRRACHPTRSKLNLPQKKAPSTVQQVSADLGYESIPAFITTVKKALGASPAKYLRNFDR